jgi:hypothetical protein
MHGVRRLIGTYKLFSSDAAIRAVSGLGKMRAGRISSWRTGEGTTKARGTRRKAKRSANEDLSAFLRAFESWR